MERMELRPRREVDLLFACHIMGFGDDVMMEMPYDPYVCSVSINLGDPFHAQHSGVERQWCPREFRCKLGSLLAPHAAN